MSSKPYLIGFLAAAILGGAGFFAFDFAKESFFTDNAGFELVAQIPLEPLAETDKSLAQVSGVVKTSPPAPAPVPSIKKPAPPLPAPANSKQSLPSPVAPQNPPPQPRNSPPPAPAPTPPTAPPAPPPPPNPPPPPPNPPATDSTSSPQAENTQSLCSDGIDNDGDSLTDLSDPDCSAFVPPPPPPDPPPPPPAPPPPSNVSHLLISEVQLTGGSGNTTNDFIELYNPLSQAVDLSGWKLRKRTQSGTESSIRVFPSASSIPAYGFFLWANSNNGFDVAIGADVSSTASLAPDSSIALLDSNGAVIDALAWGADLISPFGEGAPSSLILDTNQSMERLAWQNNCISAQGSGESLGNGCDNDDNSTDFEFRPVATPQNSQSPTEP